MFLPRFNLGIDDQRIVVGALKAADALVVAGAGLAACFMRHGPEPIQKHYIVAIAIGALLAANYLRLGRLYRFEALRSFAAQFGPLTASWLAAVVTLLLIAYFGQLSESFSRIWAIYWFVTAYLGLVFVRATASALLHRWRLQGRLTNNVVVVGAGTFGTRLIRHLDRRQGDGIRVLGLFDDRTTRIPRSIAGHDVRGNVDDLLLFARHNRIDQIIVALPWSAEARLRDILKKLQAVAADVTLCPGEAAFELPNMGYSDVGGVPMLTLQKPPLAGWNRVIKGLEDRTLALIGLIAVWPLLLAVSVAIKLSSPGPVLFCQKRYGFNNNEITVFKFRSMRWSPQDGEAQTCQARRNDERVTPIGHLLRSTSLDELPQLINVLLGDMSLVGPRPHAVSHNEEFAKIVDGYLARHRVKPGITGWAQVNGLRGETATTDLMRRRVQYDLDYIENWSLLFDLKIILLTFFTGFVHENAY